MTKDDAILVNKAHKQWKIDGKIEVPDLLSSLEKNITVAIGSISN
jgi:hypothetical protein